MWINGFELMELMGLFRSWNNGELMVNCFCNELMELMGINGELMVN